MQIGEGLTVLVDYDYQLLETGDQYTPPVAEGVTINAVCVESRRGIDIKDILSNLTLEEIDQKIFDSFDKELQEPDDHMWSGRL